MSDRLMQRIRGAIDRSLAEAEELARQRGVSPGGASTRSDSVTRSSPTQRRLAEGGPDPSVFEAAFVIDESETPSRVGTPKAATGDDGHETQPSGEGAGANDQQNDDSTNADRNDGKDGKEARPAGAGAQVSNPDLPSEVKLKLRKLEKLESTYPELLRSYRIAHGRATSIEPFERALKEHTPLTSIKDPVALVEYLNQLSLKGAMVMDEFKRVSAEKDDIKKRLDAQEAELATLKAEQSTSTNNEARLETTQPKGDEAQKVDEFFSYEKEVPIPQTDEVIASGETKNEEIEQLKFEVASLQSELSSTRDANQELDRLRDVTMDYDKLKSQLEVRASEIATLSERLSETQVQLEDAQRKLREERAVGLAKTKDLQSKLGETELKTSDLDLQLGKSELAKTDLEKKLNELIEQLEQEKSDGQDKIAKLEGQLAAATSATASAKQDGLRPISPIPSLTPSSAAGGGKKKNKKKKKGGNGTSSGATSTAGSQAPISDNNTEVEEAEVAVPSPGEAAVVAALETEIARLKEDVAEKDRLIDRLTKRRKTEEDLREEIEDLQDNLLTIGQNHVEAKERIKDLEAEKKELHSRIDELQKELEAAPAQSAASEELQKEFDSMKRDYDELKEKSRTLQTDLGATEQLAQTRFKDLSDLRALLQKVQPELKELRQDSSTLKTTKEELLARTTELRTLERKEKDLRNQLTRAQQTNKTLEERLTAETNNRLRLEDAQRASGREIRRSEADRIELSSREEKATRELQRVQEEANKLRPRVSELEAELDKLRRERDTAQKDADLKGQQYTTIQGLLTGMREQSAEVSLQLKEARSQAESLEEELGEVQRLLRERTHEGETMRRMLADVDERADTKVREMRSRLDAAMEERDRIEDEANTRARRGMRETEELRNKVRDMERNIKALQREKDDLEEREKSWRKRRDELEADGERATSEIADARSTVDGLRKALDESEAHVREAEQQRADLRRVLDEQRGRYEKLSKELKTHQLRMGIGSGSGGLASSRSSGESTHVGSMSNAGAADVLYIKTVLLQFLEQKDTRLRSQLVPVLGKLLHFDKADEQKWAAAVQHLEVK